jgi:hypothetical protein
MEANALEPLTEVVSEEVSYECVVGVLKVLFPKEGEDLSMSQSFPSLMEGFTSYAE